MKELVELGTNLHSLHSYNDCTPFKSLVGTCFHRSLESPEIARDQIIPDLLCLWLECLQESGVDLEEYGRKEAELHEEGLVSWTLAFSWKDVEITIQSLVYGPLPSDWKLEVVFRERITPESPLQKPQRVPGGWVEDEDLEQEQDLQASDD